MPDGIYTSGGWRPLPFDDREYRSDEPKKGRVWLLWGAVCLFAALAAMTVSGLVGRARRKGKQK